MKSTPTFMPPQKPPRISLPTTEQARVHKYEHTRQHRLRLCRESKSETDRKRDRKQGQGDRETARAIQRDGRTEEGERCTAWSVSCYIILACQWRKSAKRCLVSCRSCPTLSTSRLLLCVRVRAHQSKDHSVQRSLHFATSSRMNNAHLHFHTTADPRYLCIAFFATPGREHIFKKGQ